MDYGIKGIERQSREISPPDISRSSQLWQRIYLYPWGFAICRTIQFSALALVISKITCNLRWHVENVRIRRLYDANDLQDYAPRYDIVALLLRDIRMMNTSNFLDYSMSLFLKQLSTAECDKTALDLQLEATIRELWLLDYLRNDIAMQ